eukprot:TRINITY_DN2790_c0_g1_i1.p1 TRINITY_DN2790_c0_g1~~TRINITY_DN2790_c0_g1_i1.p1  ORF type:complete len:849 (+),score=168.74 TRINITY_DN2790_c0_g1_i1:128-2548(+)
MAAFEELGMMDELCKALEEMEWFLPKPVQQDAIPLILGGGDVMCAAETGAGKTGAFCLPIIQATWENLNRNVSSAKVKATVQHCLLNKDDYKDDMRVAEGGNLCSITNMKTIGGCRATFGVTKGKWAFSGKLLSGKEVKFGWTSEKGSLNLGYDKFGFGYHSSGQKVHNNKHLDYGPSFAIGDKIICLCDRDNNTISYIKNGEQIGEAFQIPDRCFDIPLFPCVSSAFCTAKVNFAPKPESKTNYKLPSGYQWIDAAKGPEQEKIFANFIRRRVEEKDKQGHHPKCVIMEPTLELCQQVVDELTKFTKYVTNPSLEVCSMFGRTDPRQLQAQLERGVDIIVCTPQRVKQFVQMEEDNVFSLKQCQFMVLDEADRLVDPDTVGVIREMYTQIKKNSRLTLQICMFSATLHDDAIQTLQRQLCPTATWVDLKGKDFVPDTVHHGVVFADPDDDDRWERGTIETDGVHNLDADNDGPAPLNRMSCKVSEHIKLLKPEILLKVIDAHKMEQCLIFCRTRDDCNHLSDFLNKKGGQRRVDGAESGTKERMEKGKENPYSNVALHSGFDIRTRRNNLEMFKEGEVRFLICTDVAARGLDIKQLPYVINMTLPDKAEDYIHRIGRTGRADRMGLAISIVTSKHREKVWYHSNCNRGMRNGSPCTDTRLVEEGGCCIWYNEPLCYREIEKRCGEELSQMTSDYQFDNADAAKVVVEYGKSREEMKSKKSDHIIEIERSNKSLSELQQASQCDHLMFKSFVKKLSAAPPPTPTPAELPKGRGSRLPAPRTGVAASVGTSVKTFSDRTVDVGRRKR